MMASTPEGARLTAAHTRAQAALQARAVRDMADIVAGVDFADPTDWARAQSALETLVTGYRERAMNLANTYYMRYRAVEGAIGSFTAPDLPVLDEAAARALQASLRWGGPGTVDKLVGLGRSADAIDRSVLFRLGGTVGRFVSDGHRIRIGANVRADPAAVGWARVANGKACAFCALLAGRGPVYSKTTVRFRAHDHCRCSAEPQYRMGGRETWPPTSRRFAEMYESMDVAPGESAMAAFRRAYRGGG